MVQSGAIVIESVVRFWGAVIVILVRVEVVLLLALVGAMVASHRAGETTRLVLYRRGL